MTEEHIKEQISMAYIRAISASAGVALTRPELDYGIDGRFEEVDYNPERKRYLFTGFTIDFQIKATTNIIHTGDRLQYDLEVKNYNDLVNPNAGLPRILIVYSMPENRNEWVTISDESLILKRCAWWCSLKGQEETQNKYTIRIDIPITQKVTPTEIIRLMGLVKEGADI